MRKILIAGLLTAVATPLLAQVAPAVPTSPRAPMGDRVITRAEVQAKVQTHFTKVDADRGVSSVRPKSTLATQA